MKYRLQVGKNKVAEFYDTKEVNSLIATGIGVSLPTPSESYRGQFFTTLGGIGQKDRTYVCVKNELDVYIWLDTVAFSFGF